MARRRGGPLKVLLIVLLVLAGIAQLAAHLTFVAVVLFVLAAGVLILRWALLGIVRRLTGFERFGPLEGRMRALIDDTSTKQPWRALRIGGAKAANSRTAPPTLTSCNAAKVAVGVASAAPTTAAGIRCGVGFAIV